MGYFSNGSEGCSYISAYCDRCVHGQGEEGTACAVMDAHFLHSDGQRGVSKEILSLLIPPSDDGCSNKQCAMFIAMRPGEPVGQGKMFGEL